MTQNLRVGKIGLAEFKEIKKHVQNVDDCWLWQGKLGVRQYPIFEIETVSGRIDVVGAARLMFSFFHKPVPRNRYLRNQCGNKLCVNPDHHAHGNDSYRCENVRKGETHPKAKLDPDKVRHIRARVFEGDTQQKLAAEFGVSQIAISHVVNRKTWAHIE